MTATPPPTIVLSGAALAGYAPGKPQQRLAAAAGAGHPVRLGRRRRAARPMALGLDQYVTPEVVKALPESIDWSAGADAVVARMLLNDQYGDCVIASSYHMEGVATQADGGPGVQGTDQEVYAAYQTICGPGDNGCAITDVLDYQVRTGLKFNGAVRKIDGYVAVNTRSVELTKAAIFLFANIKLGINLPGAWTSAAIWDLTNTGSVGGHDVPAVGFNKDGVIVLSWGRKYLITWAAWVSPKYLDEGYTVLSPGWYGADRVAANKFPVAALQDDLAKIKAGVLPDTTPPVDPSPTPAPLPAVTVSGGCSINGVQVSFQAPIAAGAVTGTGTCSVRRPARGVGASGGEDVPGVEVRFGYFGESPPVETPKAAMPDSGVAHEHHKDGGGQLPGTHV